MHRNKMAIMKTTSSLLLLVFVSLGGATNGLAIPVVKVVVCDIPDAINDALQSIDHDIPIVICAGQAADIIAYATKANEDIQVKEEVLERKILDAYKNAFKPNEAGDKCNKILENVKQCCEKAELITVHDMTKPDELHHSILLALLNAHSSNTSVTESEREYLRLEQLRLTLAWNRVDIAQEKIFLQDVQWSSGSLDEIMTEAIRNDNAEFARLLIQQGVILKDYLTAKRLNELCKMSPNQTRIERVFSRLIGKYTLSIDDLPILLNSLLDNYTWDLNEHQMKNIEGKFLRPYKELFIWALLYGRQAVAKLFWEMGEEPVTSAIAATRLYESLSQACFMHESHLKTKLNDYKREFENLAIRVIDLCHSADPDMAMILVERKSPSWDSVTCMEMAASANDQKFMSTAACQSAIETQWRSGIQDHLLMIMFSLVFVPLIPFLRIARPTDEDIYCITRPFYRMSICARSSVFKLSYRALMDLLYTFVFTKFIMMDFKAYEIISSELYCMMWLCGYILDEVMYMICLRKARKWRDIMKWYGILKILELLNFFLAVVGFIIHRTFPKDFMIVKAIYSVNCVIFCVSFTKYFVINARLGPKLVMIKRMVEDLVPLLLLLVMFMVGYGVARVSLLYTYREDPLETIKDVFYYPYWQLYGEIFLEESTKSDDDCIRASYKSNNTIGGITTCRKSYWMVKVLLCFYLIAGQLLLINLIIASFSHVFKTVEENSHEIWKFQMYFLSTEYRTKMFVPPPLNIVGHPIFVLFWLFQRNKRKGTKPILTLGEVYEGMTYDKVPGFTNVGRYVELTEKKMMVTVLNQNDIKMESM